MRPKKLTFPITLKRQRCLNTFGFSWINESKNSNGSDAEIARGRRRRRRPYFKVTTSLHLPEMEAAAFIKWDNLIGRENHSGEIPFNSTTIARSIEQ